MKKSKVSYCKLAPVFDKKVRLMLDKTSASGKRIYGKPVDFEPGVEYIIDMDDEFRIESMKALKTQVLYTQAKEKALKDAGIEYKVTSCKTCGGNRGKKLVFKALEVHIFE